VTTSEIPPRRAVVDTCGWLEYLTDGPNADFFAPAIERTNRLVVPTISLMEVFKWVMRERGEEAALQATALMQQGTVAGLDAPVALFAARVGIEERLPLADSIMLGTARAYDALLWTQDADFEGKYAVEYRPKPTAPRK
jgi:predicted nucleic acid-binding protein